MRLQGWMDVDKAENMFDNVEQDPFHKKQDPLADKLGISQGNSSSIRGAGVSLDFRA